MTFIPFERAVFTTELSYPQLIDLVKSNGLFYGTDQKSNTFKMRLAENGRNSFLPIANCTVNNSTGKTTIEVKAGFHLIIIFIFVISLAADLIYVVVNPTNSIALLMWLAFYVFGVVEFNIKTKKMLRMFKEMSNKIK